MLLLLKWIWQLLRFGICFFHGIFWAKQVFLLPKKHQKSPKKDNFLPYGILDKKTNTILREKNPAKKMGLRTDAADPVPPRAWPCGGPSPGAALPLGVAGARLGAPVALGVGEAED